MSCLQKIRLRDNIPILSYLLLRGRCRNCGASYSSRYLWVELLTGASFALLFYFDIFLNGHQLPYFATHAYDIKSGSIPGSAWLFFLHHAILLSFLIAASLCDLERRTIPLSLTITGTIIGLLLSMAFAWPWPQIGLDPATNEALADDPWFLQENVGKIPQGLYPWPVWGPLPEWMGPNSVLLGLLTGLAGAATGTLMMRAIKWLFETGLEKEALGLGDADLMMMAGSFIGWQLVVVSFFYGAIASLILVVPAMLLKGNKMLPFGPGLAIGVMFSLLSWRHFGSGFQPFFFDTFMLFLIAVILAGGIFVFSLVFRRKA